MLLTLSHIQISYLYPEILILLLRHIFHLSTMPLQSSMNILYSSSAFSISSFLNFVLTSRCLSMSWNFLGLLSQFLQLLSESSYPIAYIICQVWHHKSCFLDFCPDLCKEKASNLIYSSGSKCLVISWGPNILLTSPWRTIFRILTLRKIIPAMDN